MKLQQLPVTSAANVTCTSIKTRPENQGKKKFCSIAVISQPNINQKIDNPLQTQKPDRELKGLDGALQEQTYSDSESANEMQENSENLLLFHALEGPVANIMNNHQLDDGLQYKQK